MTKPECMASSWKDLSRWQGIKRPYTPEDVLRLRGSIKIEHTLADHGAKRFWQLLEEKPYINALGALTGNQAVQQIKAGLLAIYLSGWQVAADANDACQMYPDQSIYPSNSVPSVVKRINNALLRADQVDQGKSGINWFAPIVADAEAGFGGSINVFELMKQMIEAGASAVHFEDQLSSAKKCGHMGGKCVIPTSEFVTKLIAARLAADVCGVPTVLIGRTDANSAGLLVNDIDEYDAPFIDHSKKRTPEGFFYFNGGLDAAIARGLAYAPYCDMIWCETAHPDLDEAKQFAEAIYEKYPNKKLAYNCSPSFKWTKYLDDATIAKFQRELGAMGYKFQFITLAGFHALNFSMFELARKYKDTQMSAYVQLQEKEFKHQDEFGYSATKHQTFVGTEYFDDLMNVVTGGTELSAMKGSTEQEQFNH
jgi:isocitrate lyase